jgi:hypothetical protein
MKALVAVMGSGPPEADVRVLCSPLLRRPSLGSRIIARRSSGRRKEDDPTMIDGATNNAPHFALTIHSTLLFALA